VTEAADGTAALASLRTAPPHIAVIDVTMPGISGIDLIRRLRAEGLTLPVCVLSARDEVDDRVAGRDLDLTGREFDLLEAFARHPSQVLSRAQLLDQVWGYTWDVDSNVVDVFVGYLRRKLEADDTPRVLHTVRGTGFVLRPSR
jgi:DNA-binding response OmpR family regulator